MKVLMYSVLGERYIGLCVTEGTLNFSQAWEIYRAETPNCSQIEFSSILHMIASDLFSGKIFTDVYMHLKKHSHLEKCLEKREFTFEPPISGSIKILALARNYRAHAKELGNEPIEEPIIFTKTSNTILPHKGEIIYPEKLTRVDHEIELGVIIGKKLKYVDEEDAKNAISGYTIVNDVTARDLQKADISNQWPWLRSKNFDTFLPMGPYIVPKEFIKDPNNLNLQLDVNGKKRQMGNTSYMINSIPQVISYISGFMSLYPGDVICTGTPEGVAPLNVGDTIDATISGIGTLSNNVISER